MGVEFGVKSGVGDGEGTRWTGSVGCLGVILDVLATGAEVVATL